MDWIRARIGTTLRIMYGACWNPIYLDKKAPGVVSPMTIGVSSMQYSGYCAPARRGGTCLIATVAGATPIDASFAGETKGFGKGYLSD